MLARTRRIDLGGGNGFETPLLVPSLSSKGFAPLEVEGKETPAPSAYFQQFADRLTEAVLISAHDIHYKLIADVDQLQTSFARSSYSKPALLFIDSGWYEVQQGSDAGAPYEQTLNPADWTEERYVETIDGLADDLRAVVVSWDRDGASYREQIEEAQRFSGQRRHLWSDVLLKPEGGKRWHQFSALASHVENLRAFDVIGVAEKELGNRLLDRLKTLAELRLMLDDHDVDPPIHLFGGLDPVLTPLYFAAGAEIFDGLGWLRYGYQDGLAVHRDAVMVLRGDLKKRMPLAIGGIQLANLDALDDLQLDLKLFCARRGEWGAFRHNGDLLGDVYEHLTVEMKGRLDGG